MLCATTSIIQNSTTTRIRPPISNWLRLQLTRSRAVIINGFWLSFIRRSRSFTTACIGVVRTRRHSDARWRARRLAVRISISAFSRRILLLTPPCACSMPCLSSQTSSRRNEPILNGKKLRQRRQKFMSKKQRATLLCARSTIANISGRSRERGSFPLGFIRFNLRWRRTRRVCAAEKWLCNARVGR